MKKNLHVFRVLPDRDLMKEIMKYCEKNNIQSAIILQIMGSLKNANIGFTEDDGYKKENFEGPYEIVGGQGNIAIKEKQVIPKISISVADNKSSIGGILLSGTKVLKTAEVFMIDSKKTLKRKRDSKTGMDELYI